MKNLIKYSSIALLTSVLSTSAFAAADDAALTGTIGQAVSVTVADASTAVTMSNSVTSSQDLAVAANVPFNVTVASANASKLISGSDEVGYTFTLNDGSTTLLTAAGTAGSTEVDATWTLNISPFGIDGSTDAGTYTDTVTITVAAA